MPLHSRPPMPPVLMRLAALSGLLAGWLLKVLISAVEAAHSVSAEETLPAAAILSAGHQWMPHQYFSSEANKWPTISEVLSLMLFPSSRRSPLQRKTIARQQNNRDLII